MSTPHASNLQKSTKRGAQILFFVLATLCLLFVMSYASRLNEYARVQYESSQWDRRIDDAYEQQAELAAYRDYIKSDDYVAEVARRELNMVQPGDNIVVVIAAGKQEGDAQAANGEIASPLVIQTPVWQQWFNLFVQRSASSLDGR